MLRYLWVAVLVWCASLFCTYAAEPPPPYALDRLGKDKCRNFERPTLAAIKNANTKAVACIKALDAELLRRPDYEFSTLWWSLRKVSGYLRSHAGLPG